MGKNSILVSVLMDAEQRTLEELAQATRQLTRVRDEFEGAQKSLRAVEQRVEELSIKLNTIQDELDG